jgi:hypothetical protein
MTLSAPRTGLPLTEIEPASDHANCLNVDTPVVRTTHTASTVVGSKVRDTSETHAAMIDIDGDGNQDVVRRIHILQNGDKRSISCRTVTSAKDCWSGGATTWAGHRI